MWVLFLALLVPGSAFAAAPDFSSLVSAIDVSGIVTAILSVAGVIIGVLVVQKGVDLILDFFSYRSEMRAEYENWIARNDGYVDDDDYWDRLPRGTNRRDDIF